MYLRLPVQLIELLEDMLGLRWRKSGVSAERSQVNLDFHERGFFLRPSAPNSLDDDVAQRAASGRWDWRRERVPLLSSPESLTRSAVVALPPLTFNYRNELPPVLPTFSVRPMTVNQMARVEAHGLRATRLAERSVPPLYSRRNGRMAVMEKNRRRRDHKLYGYQAYVRALALVNRTYGAVSELEDFLGAWEANPYDVGKVGTALLLNEAVDQYYGRRSGLLREHLYSRRWYKLPVGLDTLRHMV